MKKTLFSVMGLAIAGILTIMILSACSDDDNDNMVVEVELEELFTDDYQRLQALQKRIQRALKDEILLTPHVKLVPKNTLPVSDGKAVRVIDKRKVYQ